MCNEKLGSTDDFWHRWILIWDGHLSRRAYRIGHLSRRAYRISWTEPYFALLHRGTKLVLKFIFLEECIVCLLLVLMFKSCFVWSFCTSFIFLSSGPWLYYVWSVYFIVLILESILFVSFCHLLCTYVFFRTVIIIGAFYKGFMSVSVSSLTFWSPMSPTGMQCNAQSAERHLVAAASSGLSDADHIGH